MSNKIKDMIKGAQLPERSVAVCMNVGLTAEMEVLERKLADAKRNPGTASLAGDPALTIANEIEALRGRMLEHSIEFRFRALPRLKFTELLAAHPPREGNLGDQQLGANEETLVAELVRSCTVSPELDDEDWENLIGAEGVLSSAQFDLMSSAAWRVNRRDVDVPFSLAASQTLQTSEAE